MAPACGGIARIQGAAGVWFRRLMHCTMALNWNEKHAILNNRLCFRPPVSVMKRSVLVQEPMVPFPYCVHSLRKYKMQKSLLAVALLAIGLTACGEKPAPAPTAAPAPAAAPALSLIHI